MSGIGIGGIRQIIFDRSISDAQNVILSHARDALHALIKRIATLRSLIASNPSQLEDFYIHPDIPSALSDIAFQQGAASTILFNDSDQRGGREPVQAFDLRKLRNAYVQAQCGHLGLSILPDKDVRNKLTHMDEYLAVELERPDITWLIDIAIGRRDQFRPVNPRHSLGFCRSYIASEDIILHLGYEISLSGLEREAHMILHAMWNEPL
jgi:hypothetical protein